MKRKSEDGDRRASSSFATPCLSDDPDALERRRERRARSEALNHFIANVESDKALSGGDEDQRRLAKSDSAEDVGALCGCTGPHDEV